MQSIQQHQEEKDPFLQLLILFGLIVGGIILATIASLALGLFTFGAEVLKDPQLIASNNPENILSLKLQLVFQQGLLFLAPALLLAIIEKQRPQQFYGMKLPKLELLLIVFLIMMCSVPLMGWINELNQKMMLPSFLKGIENWMRALEDAGAATTKAILNTKSIGGFVLNLFVIAIVPAICEELLFRGALQRTLIRLVKNHHMGIWISAIVFSTIHLQFFGFFPRMFLGAAFGYIYFWTGSIRYTIFAHFLNNGLAVSTAYYLQLHNLPPEKADEMNIEWFVYLISAILTLVLFKVLKDRTTAAKQTL